MFEFPQSVPLDTFPCPESFCCLHVVLFSLSVSNCYITQSIFAFVPDSLQLSFGATPFVTCSGRVTNLAPGHLVRLLDPFEYRVIRMNPTSQNVTLKKINAPENRPFVRAANRLRIRPSTFLSISVNANEPTENCLCSPPSCPRHL